MEVLFQNVDLLLAIDFGTLAIISILIMAKLNELLSRLFNFVIGVEQNSNAIADRVSSLEGKVAQLEIFQAPPSPEQVDTAPFEQLLSNRGY
jgi:hypothetical protein